MSRLWKHSLSYPLHSSFLTIPLVCPDLPRNSLGNRDRMHDRCRPSPMPTVLADQPSQRTPSLKSDNSNKSGEFIVP